MNFLYSLQKSHWTPMFSNNIQPNLIRPNLNKIYLNEPNQKEPSLAYYHENLTLPSDICRNPGWRTLT